MEECDFVTENNGILLYKYINKIHKTQTQGIVKKGRTFFKRGCNFLLTRYNISTHKTRVLKTKGRELNYGKAPV